MADRIRPAAVLAATVAELVDRIKPILAGYSPNAQGAVLCELVSLWLAGHFVPGDPQESARVREELLAAHVEAVRALIPISEQEIFGETAPRRKR